MESLTFGGKSSRATAPTTTCNTLPVSSTLANLQLQKRKSLRISQTQTQINASGDKNSRCEIAACLPLTKCFLAAAPDAASSIQPVETMNKMILYLTAYTLAWLHKQQDSLTCTTTGSQNTYQSSISERKYTPGSWSTPWTIGCAADSF